MTTTRGRRRYTEEEWVEIDRRLDALMAECHRDSDVGRRLAVAWLAGQTYQERSDWWGQSVRCDGWSAFIDETECLATWQPGPRRLYDPEVALVSHRRMKTGGFDIRVRSGFLDVLAERFVPHVLVVPPHPFPWAYNTDQLVHGWEASQSVVHLLETRSHERAIRELAWVWVNGDGADYFVPRHRCYIHDGSVIVDEACLLTWPRHPGRVALLSGRRYRHRTFQRLIQDALRAAVGAHPLLIGEVRPATSHRYVSSLDLRDAWELTKLRVVGAD